MRKPSDIASDIRKHKGILKNCKSLAKQREHAQQIHQLENLKVYLQTKPRLSYLLREHGRLCSLEMRLDPDDHRQPLIKQQIDTIEYILKIK